MGLGVLTASIILALRITEVRVFHASVTHASPWRDLIDGAKAVWQAPSQLAVPLLRS